MRRGPPETSGSDSSTPCHGPAAGLSARSIGRLLFLLPQRSSPYFFKPLQYSVFGKQRDLVYDHCVYRYTYLCPGQAQVLSRLKHSMSPPALHPSCIQSYPRALHLTSRFCAAVYHTSIIICHGTSSSRRRPKSQRAF